MGVFYNDNERRCHFFKKTIYNDHVNDGLQKDHIKAQSNRIKTKQNKTNKKYWGQSNWQQAKESRPGVTMYNVCSAFIALFIQVVQSVTWAAWVGEVAGCKEMRS